MALSRSPCRRAAGFPLLETIVTLVIVSLLVTVLMQALAHGLSLRARLLEVQGEARTAFLQESWFRDSVAGAQTDVVEGFGRLEGTADSLAFVTPAPLVAGGMARVQWSIRRSALGTSLYYADPAVEDMVVVAGPLSDAQFAYLDRAGNWRREWKPEPDAVEILPRLVRFQAVTPRGELFWMVPLLTDPAPLELVRIDGLGDGI